MLDKYKFVSYNNVIDVILEILMSNFKKLKKYLLTLLCFPFSLVFWYISCALLLVWVGYPFFCFGMVDLFQDGRSSYFIKKNPKYGSLSYYSYTDKVKNNIYDNDGNRVGSYETEGATHSGWTEDRREYVAKFPLVLIYMIIFPIHKTCVLLASFLALFSKSFYVSAKAPDDYSHIKYNRALHCFFNVVVERSDKAKDRIEKKLANNKIIKEKKLQDKKLRKMMKEERKKERLKSADNILGVVLKVLGLIGIAIALYFILK